MSGLSSSEITYEEARINQDKSTTNIIVLSVFAGLAFIILCARLASRKIQKAGFALDDYLIVVGMVRYETLIALMTISDNSSCGGFYYRQCLGWL